jgi:ribonuclease BN (tRNA processing enzyme)
MRITIVGCGDAFGSGGRYNTASLVEISDPDAGDRVCLLDCGATTMTALNAMGIDPDRIDLIMLTHLHGDHFGGIPFLLLDAQWIRQRERPLRIVGPPGTIGRLAATLENLFAGSSLETPWTFEWQVEEMEPGSHRIIEGFSIHTVEVFHPCGAPPTAVRLEAGGKVFVHSGDTVWTDALPQIAAGADLLFLECFAIEETPPHLNYAKLLAKRGAFDAKRVVLTHMGPTMLDFRDQVDRALFELAEDGLVFNL